MATNPSLDHSPISIAKLPHAKRGSKAGWPTWTGQVSPDLNERLLAILGNGHRSDLVEEALELLANRQERRGERRGGERRKLPKAS